MKRALETVSLTLNTKRQQQRSYAKQSEKVAIWKKATTFACYNFSVLEGLSESFVNLYCNISFRFQNPTEMFESEIYSKTLLTYYSYNPLTLLQKLDLPFTEQPMWKASNNKIKKISGDFTTTKAKVCSFNEWQINRRSRKSWRFRGLWGNFFQK